MGAGIGFQKIMKATPSRALIIRINLVFLAFFLVVYAALLLRPSSVLGDNIGAPLIRCSDMRECHHKRDDGVKMKVVLEEKALDRHSRPRGHKMEPPNFMEEVMGRRGKSKIGMINMDEDDVSEWGRYGDPVPILFDRVSPLFEWKDLFPEWIDEEEVSDVPSCPEIPMPDFALYETMDVVVAKLPCRSPEEGWNRDLGRLQAHLVAAGAAAGRGRREAGRKVRVVLWSKCRPMLELFRCKDLVRKEGDWWLYEPDVSLLEQKVALPVGSCRLALPLWGQGNVLHHFRIPYLFFLNFPISPPKDLPRN